MVFDSMADLIGQTPLLYCKAFCQAQGLQARLLVKLECFNPAGSAKDRPALRMILDAEAAGLLQTGATVIEPTSGNTGIALAAICAAKGYKAVFTMPDTMSVERQQLLKAYGAQVILTPGKEGMAGAIRKAEEIKDTTPGAIIAGQFDNPSNPAAHEATTGPEIWAQSEGQINALVAGVGTGGTISGCGRYLKKQNPDLYVAAVEPAASPLLSQGRSGSHGIMGIGANFIPANYDASVVDEVIPVADAEAKALARAFARSEGILVGISSGAALAGAIVLAKRAEFAGKSIAVVLTDSGERYLSTDLYT